MVCLDTSFVIDLLRGRDVAKSVMQRMDSDDEIITIAAPTIMELISGSFQSENLIDDKEKIIELLSKLTVLPLAKEEAIKAGEIELKLIKTGQIIETEDIMIAAICIQNNEILVTRNIRHFEKIKDLKIESY